MAILTAILAFVLTKLYKGETEGSTTTNDIAAVGSGGTSSPPVSFVKAPDPADPCDDLNPDSPGVDRL